MTDLAGGRPIRPVILAGGAGTRLWPLSTVERPKHLLPLLGDRSLFEQTLDRFGEHFPVSYTHLTLPTNREV